MTSDKDDLQSALEEAARRVEGLPTDLRPVAFQEAFRVIRAPAHMSVPQRDAAPSSQNGASRTMPDASDVKDHGPRMVKVAFSIAQLADAADPCTSPAIHEYLAHALATKIKGNGLTDVLRSGTPRYFSRTKGEGREFIYGLTPAGWELLTGFASRNEA